MNTEQLLINFDKAKENIPRQTTVAVTTRGIYPEVQRNYIAEKLRNGDYSGENGAIYSQRTPDFEVEGVKAYIQNEEDAQILAGSLARYNYSINNGYMFDIGAGLHSMLTQHKSGLYNYQEIITRDYTTGKEETTGGRIICSAETLKKAMFGPLVNDNGRAIHGTGDIVAKAWDAVFPILNGKAPMPRAYASLHKNIYQKDANGKTRLDNHGNPMIDRTIEALVEGEPIRVYRKVSGATDAYVIDLDYFFFPTITVNDARIKMKDQYIHTVGGLTSFLQLGARIAKKQYNLQRSIEVPIARKIVLTAQAAFELRAFAPGIISQQTQGNRYNISIRRDAVGSLYPSAVSSEGRMRFKDFSEAVATAGAYYMSAITATGIKEELLNLAEQGNPIVLLATNRGAEFPENAPNVVYLKADKIALSASQKSWQDDARKSVLKSSIADINNHQIEEKEHERKVEAAKIILNLMDAFEEE